MSAPREADRAAIAAFVDALFRHADAGGFISLRAFYDDGRGTWRRPRWLVKKLNGVGFGPVIDAAVAFAQECANAPDPVVFAPPICTFNNAETATEDDVANGVVLSVDCDAYPTEARWQMEGLLGSATAVVESGGEWIHPETGEVSPKLHLHWRLQEPTREAADHDRLKEARDLAQKLVRADASAAPLVHPLRWPGSWHRKAAPKLARIVALRESAEIDLGDALERLRDAALAAGQESATASEHEAGEPQADPLDVAAALVVIPNDDIEWPAWNRVGMAVWAATGGSTSGLAMFLAWSEKSKKHNEPEARARWNHYRTSPPDRIGAGTLFYLARQARPSWRKPSDTAKDFFKPRTGNSYDYGNGHTNWKEGPPGNQQDEAPEEEDFEAPPRPELRQKSEGVALGDFYGYMPMHSYIYKPTRALWPAGSVNSRIPPVPLVGKDGKPKLDDKGKPVSITAAQWIDRNQPVEQMTWAPGLSEIIDNRLLHEGGWIERPGVRAFNLYLPPTIEIRRRPQGAEMG